MTSVSGGTAVLNANGTVTFTPTANFNGAASFSYTAKDLSGTPSAPVTVTVNVAPVNDAPVAVADTLTATEDTAIIYTAAQLLGNDTDVDNPNSALSIASVTSGSGGTAVLNANGTVTFTPTANFNGAASFSYTAKDLSGTPSAPATVTVNVAPVNDAPVITSNGAGVAATVSVMENTKTVTTVAATDPESSAITYSIVGGADAARFTINAMTGALAFVAAQDYEHASDAGTNNVYNLVVQASDSQGGSDTQAIAVTVTNANPELVAGDNSDNIFLASADNEIFGGLGGNDTVSYAFAHAAVTANLSNILANKGEALGDAYSSIENLTGSTFNDKLTGDSGANILDGGAGGDQLDGAGGSDTASYARATAGITADLKQILEQHR